MKYIIERPINDITLNGNEQLLDHNNKVIVFDTKQDAIDHMLNYGMTLKELKNSSLQINPIKEWDGKSS